MRAIRLHDTRTKELVPLEPPADRPVGIYACGPTVYARVHVGNARPFVVFSQFKRFLEHEGHDVRFVANITDINDKIYDAARASGRSSAELAAEMTRHYLQDTERLGLGRPDFEPLASEYIGPIVELIEDLIAGDHAYVADGDVYFRVRSLARYGELSHRDVEQMDQGEGVEGVERKQDPLDFALWKARKPDEDTYWTAPWGEGRPGWHIECSAMAEQLLGLEFDVHGGGIDLLFPHHENEHAQTLAARGRPLAKTWMHNGMLQFEDSKMSKSVGNVRGLGDVLDEFGGEALILYFSGGHYRQPIAFSEARMAAATAAVRRIREAGRRPLPRPAPRAPPRPPDPRFHALGRRLHTPR